MRYLKWEVISRSNTRSCSYSKRDMIAALERAGCEVTETTYLPEGAPVILTRRILDVVRYLTDDEDPREVREDVTRSIRITHPKAGKRFLGLHC